MGLFWDLYQQSQISDASDRSGELEARVLVIENELRRTQELLRDVIGRLERHVVEDLDEDGKVGSVHAFR